MKYHLEFYFIHENAFKVYFVQEIYINAMHTISFVDSNWWLDEPSFISLVMEFDDILRWNKFFEEMSSMYSYISSTQHNLAGL